MLVMPRALSNDEIVMHDYIFQTYDGVYHYRSFGPQTICGRSVINNGNNVGRSFEGLELPLVTCLLCIEEVIDV